MSIAKSICLAVCLLVAVTACASAAQMLSEVYPGLAASALTYAKLADLPDGLILRCGEVKITQDNLESRLEMLPSELRDKAKLDQFYLLEDSAAQSFLYSEAYDWSVKAKVTKPNIDELIVAYLTARTKDVKVPEVEITRFYEENRDELGGASLSEAKAEIKNVLLENTRKEAIASYVAGLSRRYDVEVDKTWVAKQYPIAMDNPIEKARKAGKPLFVGFGSGKCAPCIDLEPILAAVKKEYAGKLDVIVVDVDQEPILGARYGAEVLPFQRFYDKAGKEVFHHIGFISKARIVAQLAKMGVK